MNVEISGIIVGREDIGGKAMGDSFEFHVFLSQALTSNFK